jgi:hypothetical protein
LGFTVMTGAPWVTLAVTVYPPANADWVVVRSAATSVASVMIPDPSLTARRAAISLPSGLDVTRTAAGEAAAAICASTSAFGVTGYSDSSGASAT